MARVRGVLTADTLLTGANVRFGKTVNSDSAATPRALTVNSPGATVFGGPVGTTFALASLISVSTRNAPMSGEGRDGVIADPPAGEGRTPVR